MQTQRPDTLPLIQNYCEDGINWRQLNHNRLTVPDDYNVARMTSVGESIHKPKFLLL